MVPTLEKIKVDGVEREYVLYVPKNVLVNPDVIISCHGGGSNGQEWWTRHWHRHTEEGFIIVCPTAGTHQGQKSHWICPGDEKHGKPVDVKTDERFILAIVDSLKSKYKVEKVFMTGFSSGAKMTHSMYVSQADKFDGFGMTGYGIREKMAALNPPALKPVRISFGTKDDGYDNPNEDVLDGPETLFWYLNKLGHKNRPTRAKDLGLQNYAITLFWKDIPALEAAKIVGMIHRWAQLKEGDPFNEDDELIKFFRKHAGMK